MASFQTGLDASPKPDTNVWLEFFNEIPTSKEFTVCHWINVKYFNSAIAACLWTYCTVENKDDGMECLSMCLHALEETANRELEIDVGIPLKDKGTKQWVAVDLKLYHHRTWNHLCWSFSAITGFSNFYHNGDMIGSLQINIKDIDLAMKGSSKMHEASIIF